MFKIYEFQCKKCNQIIEEMIEIECDEIECPLCKGRAKKIISNVSFKLLYDPKVDKVGWANDGYATSQYWKDMDAARARGEDVMPADEALGKSINLKNNQ